jgi:hypothetical protein
VKFGCSVGSDLCCSYMILITIARSIVFVQSPNVYISLLQHLYIIDMFYSEYLTTKAGARRSTGRFWERLGRRSTTIRSQI